jgi:hypothetical protein
LMILGTGQFVASISVSLIVVFNMFGIEFFNLPGHAPMWGCREGYSTHEECSNIAVWRLSQYENMENARTHGYGGCDNKRTRRTCQLAVNNTKDVTMWQQGEYTSTQGGHDNTRVLEM